MRAITRTEAIAEIRGKLLTLVDDDHSVCEVAAQFHIFCGGFARWSFLELKQRNPQIVHSHPRITPQELRDLANRWQLARQFVTEEPIACDIQQRETKNRLCRGWDEFTDEQLAAYHTQLCGEEVQIRPEA